MKVQMNALDQMLETAADYCDFYEALDQEEVHRAQRPSIIQCAERRAVKPARNHRDFARS